MEPLTQLALMTKAKLVFETGDTFLSFPALSPLTFPPERLAFADGTLDSAQDLADLTQFARTVNVIPGGVLAPVAAEEYLWDVYREVLRTARLATGVLTPDEQARYDEALDFLYDTDSDGLRRDSAVLSRYRQLRDARITAAEEYRNRQLTAEGSEDPDVVAEWTRDEPRLRAELADLERRWESEGRRADVEAAQQVEEATAARAPARVWDRWKQAFLDAVDTVTDTSLVEVAMTSFSPYDAVRGAWPAFTLDRAEMTRLAAQAPPELAAVFGAGGDPDVERVTFEYRSVSVDRPWFHPAAFRHRFWRLGAEGGELSDGGRPPQGRCPSYVAGLVLARNVVVERRTPGGASETSAEPSDRLVRLRPDLIERLDLVGVQPRLRLHPAVLPRPVVAPAPTPPLAVPHGLRLAAAPAGLPVAGAPFLRRGAAAPLLASAVRPAVAAPPPQVVAAPPPQVAVHLRKHLTAHAFSAAAVPASLAPERPGSTGRDGGQGGTGPAAPVSRDITVLALICKPLPRCPDPDPSLRWG